MNEAIIFLQSNFWRGVVLTQAGVVAGMTIAILIRYACVLHRAKSRALPIHIMCIALSYLGATCFIAAEIANRWGMQTSYRIPLALSIFVLGDAALIFMLVHLGIQRVFLNDIRDHVSKIHK